MIAWIFIVGEHVLIAPARQRALGGSPLPERRPTMDEVRGPHTGPTGERLRHIPRLRRAES